MSAVWCARNFLVQYADKFQIGHAAACFFAHFPPRRVLRRFFPPDTTARKIPPLRTVTMPHQQDVTLRIGRNDGDALCRDPLNLRQ